MIGAGGEINSFFISDLTRKSNHTIIKYELHRIMKIHRYQHPRSRSQLTITFIIKRTHERSCHYVCRNSFICFGTYPDVSTFHKNPLSSKNFRPLTWYRKMNTGIDINTSDVWRILGTQTTMNNTTQLQNDTDTILNWIRWEHNSRTKSTLRSAPTTCQYHSIECETFSRRNPMITLSETSYFCHYRCTQNLKSWNSQKHVHASCVIRIPDHQNTNVNLIPTKPGFRILDTQLNSKILS